MLAFLMKTNLLFVFTVSIVLGNRKGSVCVCACVCYMLQMKRWRSAVALDPFILLLLSTLWFPQMMHDPCTSIFRPDFLTEKRKHRHTLTLSNLLYCSSTNLELTSNEFSKQSVDDSTFLEIHLNCAALIN